MDYRIFYGDESTYDGPLEDAPPLNVICIVSTDKSAGPYNIGRYVLHAHEYYLFSVDCGKWIGVLNQTDLIDHILHTDVSKVLKGRTIRDDLYHSIIARANSDPDFPHKSAKNDRIEIGGEN